MKMQRQRYALKEIISYQDVVYKKKFSFYFISM